jgi:hypothetical protein
VAGIQCPQKIRARHSNLGRELFHAHRSNDFAKRHLKRNTFLDRRQQKFAGEFSIPQTFRQRNIPVLMSPCHVFSTLSLKLSQMITIDRPVDDHLAPPRLLATADHLKSFSYAIGV